MATPDLPTDQTTPTRPTPQQIAEAREWLLHDGNAEDAGPSTWARIRVLIDATAPPTDEDIDQALASFLNERKWYEKLHDRFMFGAGVRRFLGPVKP